MPEEVLHPGVAAFLKDNPRIRRSIGSLQPAYRLSSNSFRKTLLHPPRQLELLREYAEWWNRPETKKSLVREPYREVGDYIAQETLFRKLGVPAAERSILRSWRSQSRQEGFANSVFLLIEKLGRERALELSKTLAFHAGALLQQFQSWLSKRETPKRGIAMFGNALGDISLAHTYVVRALEEPWRFARELAPTDNAKGSDAFWDKMTRLHGEQSVLEIRRRLKEARF